ncbi:MAG: hypothetical protein KatS3mg114_0471 [Planctomycetaceae bacterium]|nr:MAG: hypothetical protein KatS3mg114_0471 [Planctomycetaceae bacterium]
MTADVFRFSISPDVPLVEAEMTLHLATFAAEGLFGMARVRLEFSYRVDAARRVILVDGTQEVGAAVVKLFVGLLLREFGEEAFRVEPVQSVERQRKEAAA